MLILLVDYYLNLVIILFWHNCKEWRRHLMKVVINKGECFCLIVSNHYLSVFVASGLWRAANQAWLRTCLTAYLKSFLPKSFISPPIHFTRGQNGTFAKGGTFTESSAGYSLFYPWSTKYWVIGLILFLGTRRPHQLASKLSALYPLGMQTVFLHWSSGFWIPPVAGQDLWPHVLCRWHDLKPKRCRELYERMLTMLTGTSWSSWSRSQRARATVLAFQVCRPNETRKTRNKDASVVKRLCFFVCHILGILFTCVCDSHLVQDHMGEGSWAAFLISQQIWVDSGTYFNPSSDSMLDIWDFNL